jgi:DNA-binding transcriptional MocR family regulator
VVARYRIKGAGAAGIAASVELGVASGGLPPGAELPPVRALAAELGVSPGTVAAAYRRLGQRGVIESDGRRGTRVRSRPPLVLRSGRALPVPPGGRDVSGGAPDPALLPALPSGQTGRAPMSYDTAGVDPDLAAAARARLAADGVPADDLLVTSGALDGIERVLSAHLRPGDRVAVEDPGWANLLDLLAATDLVPVPVTVDDEGPAAGSLAAALAAGARAAVLTSRAHNPTGGSVTPGRARALRAQLAGHPDLLVVEDDHAAELAGVPLAPLAAATRSWAFVRSVSKPYGPDLRLAVVAADPVTAARVSGRQRLGPGWVSSVLQRLVLALWTDPLVAAQVAAAAVTYDDRRTRLLAGLRGRGVAAAGRTGLNVWVPVPDETTVAARLLARGWVPAPGARFRLASRPGLRFTVSGLGVADVEALAEAVADSLAEGGRARAV